MRRQQKAYPSVGLLLEIAASFKAQQQAYFVDALYTPLAHKWYKS